jgi:hypothetical protein
MRTRIALNVAAILFIVGLAAYVHHLISGITETFVSVRVSEAKFFSSLIHENWDGVKTITEEKKKILLENLDPALAASDLLAMKTIMLMMVYLFMAGAIADRLFSIYKLCKCSRRVPIET